MAGANQGGNLVFNEDFDKEPEPAPPVATPQPAASTLVPEVEEDAVVPAVTPEKTNKQPTSSGAREDEVVLDFTSSTAAPVTTGTIQSTENVAEQPPPEATEAEPDRLAWLTLKPFQKYFDVHDGDTLNRLVASLKGPFKPSFAEDHREKPDLYGPFWIATTLIFLTVVSSNTGSYTDHEQSSNKDDEWSGDYTMIAKAAMLYYIYVFGVGFVLFMGVRAYSNTTTLIHVWCVYGYGLAPLVPVAVVMVLLQLLHNDDLSDWLTYLVVALGIVYSGGFLWRNFSTELEVFGRNKRAVLALLGAVHVVLGCMIAFYFH